MKGFLHRDISLLLPSLRIYGGLLALTLALQSYADGLACRRIMELLREKTPKPETKARKNKK